ncbi:hypothetical protein M422DRAFT_99802, partial [Sphaerobolus stellatus SS14]
FSDLPPELIEDIVNNIGDVSDLLSLALTCRPFSKLIIPWHIEYRWISCGAGRKKLWRLLTKPSLAARIQRLEILYEESDY